MNSKILIVDDDRSMLEVMEQALDPCYEVLRAVSGSEALRLLRTADAAGTALPDSGERTMAQLAAAGQGQQRIASQKAGEVSVAYATGTSSAVYTGFADLKETSFGLQLLSLVRLYARGAYVP